MDMIFPIFATLFLNYKSEQLQIPFTLACISAGVVVGLIFFLIGKVTLISAIKKLFSTFGKVTDGDLTTRCSIQSDDELGHLSNDFNGLIEQLQVIFHNNQLTSENIMDISNTLKVTAEQNLAYSSKLSDGTTLQMLYLLLKMVIIICKKSSISLIG